MRTPVSFFVQGKPQPAGSKRAFALKKGGAFSGRVAVTDANPKSRDWKIDVQHEAMPHFAAEGPFLGPVVLVLTFYVSRPANHYGTGKNAEKLKESSPAYPTTKPDATKLCRGVEDALTGIAWRDDAQVVRQVIEKRYGTPGCSVEVFDRVT